MKKYLVFLAAFAIILSACSKTPAPAPVKRPAQKVGSDRIDVQLIEQGTFNIPYWLMNGAKDRILVLLAASDGLAALKDKEVDVVRRAADKGDYDGIVTLGDVGSPGPVYRLENTVYLAHRLGIVREVYWVVPVFGSVAEQDIAGFKAYLKGVMPQEAGAIDAITLKDNIAEGKVNGVPVKIMGLQDIPSISEPVLLGIDISYLASLYQDEKRTRMLSFVSGFFKTLQQKGLSSDMVTIAASNKDGVVPFKLRFLTGYLQQMFKDPGIIDGQPPALWSERAEAWKAEQVSPKEAIPVYKNILEEFPDDAASHYDLSYAYFMTGDYESCKKELAEAVRLKPGYRPAYAEYAGMLRKKGMADRAQGFLTAIK